MNKLWTIWKYTLGSFSDSKTEPYDDHIVVIRTFILVTYLITNAFIVAGVVKHWNDSQPIIVTPLIRAY